MTLKAATLFAIIGASVDLVLTILNLISHIVTPLGRLLYVGPGGIIMSTLYTLASVTILLFFITLFSNQK